VTAALRRVEPDIGGRALAALRSPGADLVELVLPLLLNDLAALDRDLVLVVDDYHLITNPQIHEALAYLIDRSPTAFRLVLATREDPPLPIGRLRAGGELAELRAGELRFSDDETAAFLIQALGLELSGEDIARLQARTEGWPAALYRGAGLIVDAAHHATAAGDLDAAVELVAHHYAFFLDRGQLATVLRWLEALPEAVAAQDWLLCFAGTVVTAHAGDLDEAERWLDLAGRAPPLVRDGQEPAGRAGGVSAAPARRHRRHGHARASRARGGARNRPGVGARPADGARVRTVVGGTPGRGEGDRRDGDPDGADA
jgi:ATP/maltotriose-dependent transcriptional regulator MalT